jgi:hypothetical protein
VLGLHEAEPVIWQALTSTSWLVGFLYFLQMVWSDEGWDDDPPPMWFRVSCCVLWPLLVAMYALRRVGILRWGPP